MPELKVTQRHLERDAYLYIRQSTPRNKSSSPYPLLRESNTTFPGTIRELESFLHSSSWKKVRTAGLLLV